MEGDIPVDSSAALLVISRKGAGRLRHVRVGQLWVQENHENEQLRYRKVKGTDNLADTSNESLAKHSHADVLTVGRRGHKRRSG